jgi:hypothetical protein
VGFATVTLEYLEPPFVDVEVFLFDIYHRTRRKCVAFGITHAHEISDDIPCTLRNEFVRTLLLPPIFVARVANISGGIKVVRLWRDVMTAPVRCPK